MKKLQQDEYFAKRVLDSNKTFQNQIYQHEMENMKHLDSIYNNVTFQDIVLTHITFEKCDFYRCTFHNVTSRKTFFVHSTIYNSIFNDTNFYDYKFRETKLINTSIVNMKPGCSVDFDVNYSASTVYLEALLGQLAVVPGTVLAAFLMDKLGRVRVMGECEACKPFHIEHHISATCR